MIVLGVNAHHADASACVLVDGVLVAAAEEERFRRIKHWSGFPERAVRYCLSEVGARVDDVDHIAIHGQPGANRTKALRYILTHLPDPRLILATLREQRKLVTVEERLRRMTDSGRLAAKIHRVEHHYSHLASAFLVSPFDRAVALSIDGFGDFASAAWGLGQGSTLGLDGHVFFPHSLGHFYTAVTQLLGFPHYGDEYKVMGLAPYGQPTCLEQMRKVVGFGDDGSYSLDMQYFRHGGRERIDYEFHDCRPRVGHLFSSRLAQLLARRPEDELDQHARDIACSAQRTYEDALFNLLNRLHARYGTDALALAGGCAMNSVANGKITSNTPFRRVYVQPAANDAGGALGAAMAVWQDSGGERARQFTMDHAYWGPSSSNRELRTAVDARSELLTDSLFSREEIEDEEVLCASIAQAIADGKVVGWFQGRMEWGPRALGNRSLLGDPRRLDMKQLLNQKIKRRESFRPFAPSVLSEHATEWFGCDDDVPFMMKVFPVRGDRRQDIPAVTHVDGSGRLQTVRRETNPRYYQLIEHFRRLTGVPLVLNTSFNENEPIVCQPEEALDCFLRTGMDVLVLDQHVISRKQV